MSTGNPPSIGWWPSSVFANGFHSNYSILRWWDGVDWSEPVSTSRSEKYAAARAKVKIPANSTVYWAPRPDNWPPHSYT